MVPRKLWWVIVTFVSFNSYLSGFELVPRELGWKDSRFERTKLKDKFWKLYDSRKKKKVNSRFGPLNRWWHLKAWPKTHSVKATVKALRWSVGQFGLPWFIHFHSMFERLIRPCCQNMLYICISNPIRVNLSVNRSQWPLDRPTRQFYTPQFFYAKKLKYEGQCPVKIELASCVRRAMSGQDTTSFVRTKGNVRSRYN